MDNINLNRENGQKLWAADWNKLVSTINQIIDAVNNQSNQPGITKLSQLINDSGFITQEDVKGKVNKGELAEVATSGSYNDLKDKPSQMTGPQGPEGKSAYQVAVQNGFIGTPQQWLNSLKGESGQDGVIGQDGQDGITPHIDSSTKHWMIGETDTGVVAEGQNGSDGQDGLNGVDGKSAYQSYVETTNDSPIKTEAQWIASLKGADGTNGTNGIDGQDGSNGTNGITPHIDPITKHWMIGETDTDILAEGVNGQDGTNGINGQDGVTPHIDSTTGNWFIGNTDTGVRAHGFSGDYNDLSNKPKVLLVSDSSYSYKTPINPNNVEYVEIEGIKWATMNLGANSITDVGQYFQWGDTQGYNAEQVGINKNFSWTDYKYNNNGSNPSKYNMSKYNSSDEKRVIDQSDDAAYNTYGGTWRMPTQEEVENLYDNTSWKYTSSYNNIAIPGIIFTYKKDSSKKLFFPFGGVCRDGSIDNQLTTGYYWTSNINIQDLTKACYFGMSEHIINYTGNDWYRRSGMFIRPILDETEQTSFNASIVAITGSYNDLKDKPDIVTQQELEESEEVIAEAINRLNENIPSPQIQSDWNQSDNTAPDYIKNKPNISEGGGNSISNESESQGGTTLSAVTTGEKYIWNHKSDFSGSYNDLTNKPVIPTVPGNESASSEGSTLSVVTTGDKYNWNNKASIWSGTQVQYEALSPNYDSNTIYIITQ